MTEATTTTEPEHRVEGDTRLDAVTGAFSYSGSAIARALLGEGRAVRTLTMHPDRGVGNPIEARALDFDDPNGLVRSLGGVTTLYNTYWVRFAHGTTTHDTAVENSRTLFLAAKRAGVAKVVHVSILHPSSTSPYPYFRGKALCERALAETGLPYAVLRPSVLFDERGVLLNNIAWLLRHLPVFAIGGRGDYRVRPIHVDDLARLAVSAATWRDDRTVDAVGPERPTFSELVSMIRAATSSRSMVVHVPAPLLLAAARVLGVAMRDVVLTQEEYRTMRDGLADSDAESTGATMLSTWLAEHGDGLGREYRNELDLHFRSPERVSGEGAAGSGRGTRAT
ncbi:MAG TPA: NAD-dependent epimerase/dehydratase family protein [Acidimicrobiales bacterium]